MNPKMKLLVSLSSPFARKCRIASSELHLTSQIHTNVIDPWTDAGLRALNPLAKVPTLIREDGTAIYDSRVIVEYLNHTKNHVFCVSSTSKTRSLLTEELSERRWRALRLQAVVDDACAAAGRLYAAEKGPNGLDVMQTRNDRLNAAVLSTLDMLENERLDAQTWDLGDLCAALLPAYCSFRWPKNDWKSTRPKLASFVEKMEQKPSFMDNPHS